MSKFSEKANGVFSVLKNNQKNIYINICFFVFWCVTIKIVMGQHFEVIVERIHDRDPRYREGAYLFVMEAMSYTQRKYGRPRHVSGEELLSGIRELLLKRFGPMTVTVLNHWGIQSTEDFGNVVFNLVDNRVLSKTEEDDIDQFRNGYDFTEVFHHGYRKQLHKKISRMR